MRMVAGILLVVATAYAQLTSDEKQLNIESFEKVWTPFAVSPDEPEY
jgi:hypothetical protein